MPRGRYDEVKVPITTPSGHPQRYNTELVFKPTVTKYATLLADLAKLREEEPSFRAVIFTRFDVVQTRLVRLLKDASTSSTSKLGILPNLGILPAEADASSAASSARSKATSKAAAKASKLQIYEFNRATAPQSRHKRISDFQNSQAPNPRVFVVTYATAAVGITLTAATRVYLMEPCPDPAQEVQAAGRIHRLGQTRDIFIVRYAFRDSIEAATCALHDKIKSGEIVIRDGKFPPRAHELFRQFGPAGQLFRRCGEEGGKVSAGSGLIDWQGEKQPPRRKPGVAPKLSQWTRSCSEEECVLCGAKRLAPASSTWSGTGIFEYLNREPHKHADPPVAGSGVGVFAAVPRPPDEWMEERFKSKGFLALINTRADKEAALDRIEEEERRNRAAGNSAGAGSSGLRGSAADEPIDVDDDDDDDEEEGGGGGGGGGGSSGRATEGFDVMKSDDGGEYLPSDQDDCSECSDELASDDNAAQLDRLLHNEYGHHNGHSPDKWYGTLTLFGRPRDVAAKEINDQAAHLWNPEFGQRIPRGSACAPPPPATDAGADADDEEEAEPPPEAEEEEPVEEMNEEEQLYADFFGEACRDDDAELEQIERDALDGVATEGDEFYGGRQEEEEDDDDFGQHLENDLGYGYSDEESYDSDDPYG